jgi:hypothetical protein
VVAAFIMFRHLDTGPPVNQGQTKVAFYVKVEGGNADELEQVVGPNPSLKWNQPDCSDRFRSELFFRNKINPTCTADKKQPTKSFFLYQDRLSVPH